jgi:hypothetical protein
MPQVPFVSNFHKLKQAVDIGMLPRKPDHDYTIGEIFSAFEDPGCFALKLIFNYQGERLRVDYTLTLSGFNLQINQEALELRDEDSESHQLLNGQTNLCTPKKTVSSIIGRA